MSLTKEEFTAQEGVQKVPFSDSWPFTICNLLEYGNSKGPERGEPDNSIIKTSPKIDVHQYARTGEKPKFELTEGIILNHLALYLEKNKAFPSIAFHSEVESLPSYKWNQFHRELKKTGTGLWRFQQDFVVEQALKHKERYGELPHEKL